MPWSESTPAATPAPAPGAATGITPPPDARSRDVEAAALLGWFHVLLAVPVLAGVAFADLTIDRVLNLLAAVALAAVGAFFLWWARRLRRRTGPAPRGGP